MRKILSNVPRRWQAKSWNQYFESITFQLIRGKPCINSGFYLGFLGRGQDVFRPSKTMRKRNAAEKRPTISDVARLASVSVGTVSAVLNMPSTVRPRLRARVEEAIEALDYYPSQIARSLRSQRTHTIGMIVPNVANQFFSSVIRGSEKEAQKCGYSIILCDANDDREQEHQHLNILFSHRVDGVLISSSNHQAVEDRHIRRRFPIGFFDRIPRGYKGDAVLTDNISAAYRAVHYLIQLGHRRVAIIVGPLDLSVMADRLEGHRKAMEEAGLAIPASYIQQGSNKLEGGHRCGLELLRLPRPPTAIFSCNNLMTLGLMGALVDRKLTCPDQVSVLGFDDPDWAATLSPRLTVMAQPTGEMGRIAMELLVQRIESPPAEPASEQGRIVVLDADLCVRASTAPPPLRPKQS